MTAVQIARTTIEIIVIFALVYGFYREPQMVKLEDKVLTEIKRRMKHVVSKKKT